MLRAALIFLLSSVLGGLSSRSDAAGLECPDIGPPGIASNLLTDVQVRLIASGNAIDLVNATERPTRYLTF
jgi:hypothetical protein